MNCLCFTKTANTSAWLKASSKLTIVRLSWDIMLGSIARISYPAVCKANATLRAGDSRKSSMLGLNAKPKHAILGFLPVLANVSATAILILSITQSVLWLLTSRAVRISFAFSKSLAMINHGSTAIQCPPTPGPGCKILTRG